MQIFFIQIGFAIELSQKGSVGRNDEYLDPLCILENLMFPTDRFATKSSGYFL